MDSGLAGVVVAETVLSRGDGEQGILWVRGHTLPQLVADFGYEGTVALLWEGFAGGGLTRAGLQAELGAAREVAFARRGEWLEPAAHRPLAEGLRIALAVLPVAVAALLRRQRGEAPISGGLLIGAHRDLRHRGRRNNQGPASANLFNG